jgi:hypothetical protein
MGISRRMMKMTMMTMIRAGFLEWAVHSIVILECVS